MPDHYYTENPNSAHDERRIALRALGNDLTFVTDAGVFSRDGLDRGTEVLLEALPPLEGRVLDLGCGWGAVGVALGKRYPELDIVMTVINSRAVGLARRNLAENGVSATVLQGDAERQSSTVSSPGHGTTWSRMVRCTSSFASSRARPPR